MRKVYEIQIINSTYLLLNKGIFSFIFQIIFYPYPFVLVFNIQLFRKNIKCDFFPYLLHAVSCQLQAVFFVPFTFHFRYEYQLGLYRVLWEIHVQFQPRLRGCADLGHRFATGLRLWVSGKLPNDFSKPLNQTSRDMKRKLWCHCITVGGLKNTTIWRCNRKYTFAEIRNLHWGTTETFTFSHLLNIITEKVLN